MALNDFLGVGKILPIDKLVDVVSSSVGRVSKSYFGRKDADTKAYEIKKLAEARAEEMRIMSKAVQDNYSITGGIDYIDEKIAITSPKELPTTNENFIEELNERKNQRIDYQQNKKQLNIETVTSYAAEELKNEQPINDEPLDEDWTTRFFNIAEDISNEEMQALWGRILAGEIKEPKSYSFRTLEFLKNLSKSEADIFTKFAEIRINSGDKNFIYNPKNDFLEKEFGIYFTDKLLMVELGLIVSKDSLEFSLNPSGNNKVVNALQYGEKAIVLYKEANVPKQGLEVLVFTKIGLELSKLITQSFNLKYTELICSKLKHPNVRIEYGDFINLPNNRFRLLNNVKFE